MSDISARPEPVKQDEDERTARLDIMLAEYKTLRDELIKKMDHRTTYRVSATTLSIALTGVGVERRSSALLLLVPVIAILLNNAANFCSRQISSLSSYIRIIESKVNEMYPDAIGWHVSVADRQKRFIEILPTHHLPNSALVLTPSAIAIALSWTYRDSLWVSVAMTIVDAMLLSFYIWSVYRYDNRLAF